MNQNDGMYRPDLTRSDQHYDHSPGGLGTPPTWLAPNRLSSSAFNAAYVDFTPAWTSTGTAPALGNAVVVSKYKQAGKFIHFYGSITFGSTSTFGTGNYRFNLPVAALTAAPNLLGTMFIYDSSATATGFIFASLTTSTTYFGRYGGTYLGTDAQVGATTPWTWATSDAIAWNLMYESA